MNTATQKSCVDSILLLSFGGPERPDDVMPFLRNVTQGRGVPDERLAKVAEQYMTCGGKSPINAQNRELIASLQIELRAHGIDLPVYWGNRNWDPLLTDTIGKMTADGCKNTLVFVTSAYSSYSGCRQYLEDIERARTDVGDDAPQVKKLRQFFNHPGFIEPMTRNTQLAVNALSEELRNSARIVFTAHSIPVSMANNSRYEAQLREAALLIAERLDGTHEWDLAFQSRSGSPQIPWLEPDLLGHLETLSTTTQAVVLSPIGFISDHMEVVYDLDVQAAQKAEQLGLTITRAKTVGADPQFVSMIRELIQEQLNASEVQESLGNMGPIGCLSTDCLSVGRPSTSTCCSK